MHRSLFVILRDPCNPLAQVMNASDTHAQRIAELEQRVAQLTEQHAAATRELEAFVYAVSHDLRAPLRSLSGFGQALLETIDSGDEKTRHYLDRIQQASRKLSELIDALLALSRISRAEVYCRELDFTQLCHEALDGVQARYPGRSIVHTIAPGLRANGDSRLLRVAMEALLDNAVKFSDNETPVVIEIGQTADGVFFVRDHGVGFEMSYVDKLFKPFQRLHGDNDFPGLGVGLATVQRVLARHNGRAWMTSAPNLGTTAFFTLSAAQGKSAPPST